MINYVSVKWRHPKTGAEYSFQFKNTALSHWAFIHSRTNVQESNDFKDILRDTMFSTYLFWPIDVAKRTPKLEFLPDKE